MKLKKVLILHGANLNFLGKRDSKHYGHLTLSELEQLTAEALMQYQVSLCAYQSNHEGALIDTLQAEAAECMGLIINPGAFSYSGYALHDAILDSQLPTIEVHLSAIEQRETWRQQSVIAPACLTSISGKKEQGYLDAVARLMQHLLISANK